MIDEDDVGEKLPHPQKNVNWLSLLTFWYVIPIFRHGTRREFDENDLTEPLDEHKSAILGEMLAICWSKEVRKSKEKNTLPDLTSVLFKLFSKGIILQGLYLFIMEVPVRLLQPLFLGLLVRYFTSENQNSREPTTEPTYIMRIFQYWKKQSPIQIEEALFFAFGIIFCSVMNVIVIHPCMMAIMHLGMKMRIACCSLIYRKALRLDLVALTGPTVGTVVNLLSNDVNRFDLAVLYLHYIWIAPFQLLLSLLLMYKVAGLSAVWGTSAILVFIPLQAWFGNRTSRFRLATACKTDDRVRQMNEIIQAMQVIKMYTWEYAFAQQIHKLRSEEMEVIQATSYIRGTIMSFIMFTSRLAVFFTVLALVLNGNAVTAEKVFVITSFYQILRQTMTLFFPYAIAQIAETNVAITRIKNFLMMPESNVGDNRVLDPSFIQQKQSSVDSTLIPSVSLSNVSVKIEDRVCLLNVSLKISSGELTAVIGQVGSGKTCLLNTILGELRPYDGKVEVSGRISYACQEPWLFAGSVRQNILFGKKFEEDRYRAIVKACALERDFELLPFGDETIVGDKGASLSGGQKARINLARAVYKRADIYLLDDPLSAVDAQVGKHLFEYCFSDFLSEKIVILVTHQMQFLRTVNKVVLMHDGKIEAQGTYTFLENAELDFSQFLRNQLSVDSNVVEPSSINIVKNIIQDLQKNYSLHSIIINKDNRRYKPQKVVEMRSEGSVQCHVYKEYAKSGGNWFIIFAVFLLFLGAQLLVSGGDFFLAQWVDIEEKRSLHLNTSNSLFRYLSTENSIVIYSVLILSTVVVALTRSFIFFSVCTQASINLHDRSFQSIITASMQFFNTNSSGQILNRFSKDLGAVDEVLPNAMIDFFQILLNLFGAAGIVIAVNYLLLFPTLLVCIIFILLRALYLRTSRSVKRLEGISRSPVFAHINATIQGLATIRSNNSEMVLTQEFDALQDDHSSAWFMFMATSRAFGLWLDLICVIYVAMITYSFLIMGNTGSNVGLAITTSVGLTGLFQWGLKQSAELENQMTSVERILEYTKIEHESDLESTNERKPPLDWPPKGAIEFQNLYMKYKPEDPPVLKSLNLTIYPREKIGIVGRTGAGKSSLIGALFRLAYYDGSVVIDGINTKDIGLHDLRRKISIIPQEPILFSGTLRYNMDPFGNCDDNAVFRALLDVESRDALENGLECLQQYVSEGGVNISVGERQMICLARAVLRNNRILVLDEATANVDPQTDRFIQTTIRQKFAHCTVLTIAHRLHTIMDSDRVLVMDAGQAVEFDHPHILLQKETGYLTTMVEKTGGAMANNLKEIAKMNYELKHGQS